MNFTSVIYICKIITYSHQPTTLPTHSNVGVDSGTVFHFLPQLDSGVVGGLSLP